MEYTFKETQDWKAGQKWRRRTLNPLRANQRPGIILITNPLTGESKEVKPVKAKVVKVKRSRKRNKKQPK